MAYRNGSTGNFWKRHKNVVLGALAGAWWAAPSVIMQMTRRKTGRKPKKHTITSLITALFLPLKMYPRREYIENKLRGFL